MQALANDSMGISLVKVLALRVGFGIVESGSEIGSPSCYHMISYHIIPSKALSGGLGDRSIAR